MMILLLLVDNRAIMTVLSVVSDDLDDDGDGDCDDVADDGNLSLVSMK